MRTTIAAFLLFLAFTVSLQWHNRAYQSEFAGDPDEAAHYVTGLLVHDYIASGLPGPPMAFAQDYYSHYPKVGLGHWPPVYYAVQAGWTLLFTPSRASVMLLHAVIPSLLAIALFLILRRQATLPEALAMGLFFLSVPAIATLATQVMADTLVAFLIFLSSIALARYFESGDFRFSAGFGLLASLTILTKGSGFVLAFFPVFMLLLAREYRWLRRPSFWLPALIAAALCLPWYLFVPGAQHEKVIRYGGLFLVSYGYTTTSALSQAVLERSKDLLHTVVSWTEMAGFLFPLALIGFWDKRSALRGIWGAAAATLIAVPVFRFLVAAAENHRFSLAAIPALLLFASAGIRRLRLPQAVVLPCIAAAIALNIWLAKPKLSRGYVGAATAVMATPIPRGHAVLVSSDPKGEGALIAEIAMREQRPGSVVLRASKSLAHMGWTGKRHYTSLVHTPQEAVDLLGRLRVSVLVLESGHNTLPRHHGVLEAAVQAFPEVFRPLAGCAGAQNVRCYLVSGQSSVRNGEAGSPAPL